MILVAKWNAEDLTYFVRLPQALHPQTIFWNDLARKNFTALCKHIENIKPLVNQAITKTEEGHGHNTKLKHI